MGRVAKVVLAGRAALVCILVDLVAKAAPVWVAPVDRMDLVVKVDKDAVVVPVVKATLAAVKVAKVVRNVRPWSNN